MLSTLGFLALFKIGFGLGSGLYASYLLGSFFLGIMAALSGE